MEGKQTIMTKAEIVQALYSKVGGFSRKESAELVDLVFEMMKETLGRGEKIKVSGFGNFVLRDKRQRPGRNPQTGQPIKISERRVLTFKASQILKQALNDRIAAGGTSAGAVQNGARRARRTVDGRFERHEQWTWQRERRQHGREGLTARHGGGDPREPSVQALLPHRRGRRARRRRAARAPLLGARVPHHPPHQERQGPARLLAARRREPDARARAPLPRGLHDRRREEEAACAAATTSGEATAARRDAAKAREELVAMRGEVEAFLEELGPVAPSDRAKK